MQQSHTRVSGMSMIAKLFLVALLSLLGLSVVGVGQAAAAGVTVKSLTPATGPAGGGNAVTIAGSGFATTTSISVGSVAVSTVCGATPAPPCFTINSGIKLTLYMPAAAAGAPAANEIVVTSGGIQSQPSSPGVDVYTYTWSGTPAVTGVGLIAVTGTVQSGSSVTVSAAGTWTVGEQVSLQGLTNHLANGVYTVATGGTGSFVIPYAGTPLSTGTGAVSPAANGAVGPIAGGTSVVVMGSDFGGASAVDFGSTPATGVTLVSSTELRATTPASGAAGPVDVTVTIPATPAATSPVTPATDTYSYLAAPTVTGLTTTVSPAGGPAGGGTQVTIAGTSFSGVTAVDFGSTPASSYVVNGLTSITAVSPSESGSVPVTVTTGLGTSGGSSDTFAYNSTLTVVGGSASYSNSPGTTVPVTSSSQTGSTVTLISAGTWAVGQRVGLSGFTNGITDGTYTVLGLVTGGFTITYAPTVTSGTGNAVVLNTATPSSVTGTSVSSGSVNLSAVGTWFAGQEVFLSGFTNGLAAGNYAVTAGGSGTFTVAGTTTASGTGIAIPYQAQSFNAATLVTGGGTISPTVSVTTPPASGTVRVEGSQLIYIPAQSTPTSYVEGSSTVWLTGVTTTGTQSVTFQVNQTAPSASSTTGTITYTPAASGFYVGNLLNAAGQSVAVVEDTGSSVTAPTTATTGTAFTTVTAPSEADLPSTNSDFIVNSIGGYQAVTPVPTGVTLVPGSLSVTGGDAATTGRYTATLCTQAMGFVPNTCTANFTGNFHATYPYVETSLNVGTTIPGGSQLSLPTVSASWQVSATSGTLSAAETEFVVNTNVQTIGLLALDAYPSDLASYLDQGLNAPAPTYATPPARWSVNVTASGPTITSVVPSSGPVAGGNSVVLNGADLSGATSVTIGGAAATVTANTATSITVTAPAGTAGAADVVAIVGDGTATDTGGYTYVAAPTISSVTPNTGPVAGGTSVVIAGTNLADATSVTIGGTAATVTADTATSITATTPSGTAGAADVVVTTAGGSVTDTGGFTYVAAPTISSVTPDSGPTAGGTSVVIAGTNLADATSVTVGGTAATVTADTATSITATTPAGSAGAANVVVTTAGGSVSDTGGFTYVAAPTVSSVTPNKGPVAGGTSVVIAGTNLADATSVTVGGTAATVTADTATSITATTPAGTAGAADVVVTTAGGSVTDTGGFTYVAAPTISSVTPAQGPLTGGTSITIAGTNLANATSVTVGGTAATVTADTATSITATTPAGSAGAANVVVTTAGGPVTDTGAFTYQSAPTITSVTPNTGSIAGGDPITIIGTHFLGASAVTIGGKNVESFTVVSATEITATTPSGSVGAANVVVTTTSGSVTDTGGFTYVAGPAISSIVPSSGPLAGGNTVVINGSDLSGATSVTFGGTAATITGNTATSITVTAPSGSAGAVDVAIVVTGGSTTSTGGYTYQGDPTISSVTPGSGPTSAGTGVVIAGTNLVGATSVTIGGTAASITADTATSITVTAPAGSVGAADVVVTTASGSVTDTGGYTYVAAPTISSVTPNEGPVAGGTSVVIAGTNLADATSVTIGGTAATVTADSATSITATTPARSAGVADVVVATAGGSVTDTGGYTYVAAPTISSVTPDKGPLTGGTSITIAGANLADATSVTVGGTAATVTANTATSITATTPAGSVGVADVVVTTAGGSVTDTGGFTYEGVPTITSVTPDTGSVLGGTAIVIDGTNLLYPTSVTIGGRAATVTDDGPTSIDVTTPVGAAGAADVVVTTAGGSVTDTGGFTYAAVAPLPPTVTGVTPGDMSVTVSWAPGDDGGSPITSYTAYATLVLGPGLLGHKPADSCTVPAPATSCTITGLVNGSTYTFQVVASNGIGSSTPSAPSTPAVPGENGAIAGYWMATSSGAVLVNGAAVTYGSPAGLALSAPIVGLVPTPDRHGYWMVGADGGVFSYGDATFYGSTGGTHLNAPIVGMAATSDGKGYWLVASDGGVFAYGDAAFAGSLGGTHLNAPVVGIAGNGTGGYWLVASDGGVFAYGTAKFAGSAGSEHLNSPIVGIAPLADGTGYYLAAADGGVFAYGATFYGSASGAASNPVVGIAAGQGGGYTLATSTGAVFAYGTGYHGNQSGTATTAPIIGISS